MKTVLIHKNSLGMVFDNVVVDDAAGMERTLSGLLRDDWIFDAGAMISIEAMWAED